MNPEGFHKLNTSNRCFRNFITVVVASLCCILLSWWLAVGHSYMFELRVELNTVELKGKQTIQTNCWCEQMCWLCRWLYVSEPLSVGRSQTNKSRSETKLRGQNLCRLLPATICIDPDKYPVRRWSTDYFLSQDSIWVVSAGVWGYNTSSELPVPVTSALNVGQQVNKNKER